MYAYFDDTKRFWYYLCFVYVLCIPIYAFLRYLQMSIFFSMSSVIVAELIAYVVIVNYYVNKADGYMRKIECILYEECDAQLFQKEISKLLERSVKNQTQRCKLINYMALCERLMGNVQEAITLLKDIQAEVERLGNDRKCPIYIAMAQCYLDVQEINEAWTFIQLAQKTLYNRKLSTMKSEGALEEVLQRYRYMIGEIGTHEYIIFLKKTCKEKTETTLHKVVIYGQLMQMSKRTKNDNEAAMCAYYIVKHAKNLACVDAANKLLGGNYE